MTVVPKCIKKEMLISIQYQNNFSSMDLKEFAKGGHESFKGVWNLFKCERIEDLSYLYSTK